MDLKQNIIIESIGVYLPPQSISTEQILSDCKNKIQFPLEKISGISSRRMAGQDEFAIDLAKNAVADCLARSKYSPTDIDLLICCSISRFDGTGIISFEPNTSIKLKQHFGFENAIAFDITNACAGMFTGISIVESFIKNGTIRNGMVISGEYITHLTNTAQAEIEGFMDTRLACLTLGDAGAALILEKASDGDMGFEELDIQTFGGYSQYCIAKASEQGGMIMYTDSLNLTNAGVKSGAKHSMDLLQRSGWSTEGFQHLVMHQTSAMTLNSAMREINRLYDRQVCNNENTINNLELRGNTASTAHFVAIYDQIQNNKINSGDRIIFSITASGLTIGTALYVFDDLPDRLRQSEPEYLTRKKLNSVKQRTPLIKSVLPRIQIESVGTTSLDSKGRKNSLESGCLAANDCIKNSAYGVNEIELLIYCGVYRSEYLLEPAYATLLAGKLEMNAMMGEEGSRKTFAFDIFNGSLGFLNACYVAQQMIAAGKCSTAMIAASESDDNLDSETKEPVGVREIASAFVLDVHSSANKGFSGFLFKSYVQYLDAYISNYKTGDKHHYMQVVKNENLEELYISCILSAVSELLETESLDLNDIDLFFPPQISSNFIKRLSMKLKVESEKFIDVVGDGPDLFSSSIACAFKYANEKGFTKSGDVGLMISVGSGIQVGCALYYF